MIANQLQGWSINRNLLIVHPKILRKHKYLTVAYIGGEVGGG